MRLRNPLRSAVLRTAHSGPTVGLSGTIQHFAVLELEWHSHGGGYFHRSLSLGAIMSLCVAGWQLRPWARLCLRYQRSGNAAAEPHEASRDIPDFPEAILWSVAAAA
jgi:hypothetical protein